MKLQKNKHFLDRQTGAPSDPIRTDQFCRSITLLRNAGNDGTPKPHGKFPLRGRFPKIDQKLDHSRAPITPRLQRVS